MMMRRTMMMRRMMMMMMMMSRHHLTESADFAQSWELWWVLRAMGGNLFNLYLCHHRHHHHDFGFHHDDHDVFMLIAIIISKRWWVLRAKGKNPFNFVIIINMIMIMIIIIIRRMNLRAMIRHVFLFISIIIMVDVLSYFAPSVTCQMTLSLSLGRDWLVAKRKGTTLAKWAATRFLLLNQLGGVTGAGDILLV